MKHTSWSAVALGIVAGLGAVSAGAARAQEAPPGWFVAAGTDFKYLYGPGVRTNLGGLLGHEWQRPGSRLSWRVDVSYHQRTMQSLVTRFLECTGDCRDQSQFRLMALEGDVKFELTRGRIRPYVASGLGIYQSKVAREVNYSCSEPVLYSPSCSQIPGPSLRVRDVHQSLGLHAGFGLAATIGRVHLFGEVRPRALSNSPEQSWHTPVLIGVRF